MLKISVFVLSNWAISAHTSASNLLHPDHPALFEALLPMLRRPGLWW
jgi:hypothetical protein